MAVELRQIAVYAIDVPRDSVPVVELEHLLGGRSLDFHAAFGKAQEEAKPDRDLTRARIEKLEFRRFRNTRTIFFLGSNRKLNRQFDDPGNDMRTEFPEEPTIDRPLDFVVAHANGHPVIVEAYRNHAKEDPEDYVARVARGEVPLIHDGHPIEHASLTHLAVHHLVCEVMSQCFERPWWLKLSGALLRTDLPLKFNDGGVGLSP